VDPDDGPQWRVQVVVVLQWSVQEQWLTVDDGGLFKRLECVDEPNGEGSIRGKYFLWCMSLCSQSDNEFMALGQEWFL
jgi:hypothetical protein